MSKQTNDAPYRAEYANHRQTAHSCIRTTPFPEKPDYAALLAEQEAATLPEPEIVSLSHSLAYERACIVIETRCSSTLEDDGEWFDLESTDIDIWQEVSYLFARRLLRFHEQHPLWVQLLDEDEGLPEVRLASVTLQLSPEAEVRFKTQLSKARESARER